MLKEKFMQDSGWDSNAIAAESEVVSMLIDANPEYRNGASIQFPDSASKKYGVKLTGDFGKDISKELTIFNDNKTANQYLQMAMDVDTYQYSVPSNGVPSWFTTIWTNKLVKQLLQTTPFKRISLEYQQGMFGTTDIKIPTISYDGQSRPYSDYSGDGNTSVNLNWVDRETITLQRTLTYGDMAIAQMGMAKIDYVANLREGLANLVALDQDQIGFYGYAGVKVFGVLNDPSLNATITAATGAAASTLWANKTFFEIVADIITLVATVVARAGGNADSGVDKFYLALPPAVIEYMNRPNALGNMSVTEYVKEIYPNMEVVQAQFLQGNGSPIGSGSIANKALLIWDRLGGQECVLNAFSTLWNSHGVVRESSYYNEKMSYVLSGAVVAQPTGVQIMTGI